MHRPDASPNAREAVINGIMTDLYYPHLHFWWDKLKALISVNAINSAREDKRDNGLSYAGSAWFVPFATNTRPEHFDILPLHPKTDEKEVIQITSNLKEIDVEMYEIRRFLAGMMLFAAPLDIIEKYLGGHLFGFLVESFDALKEDLQGISFDKHKEEAFKSFMENHDFLIDAMAKRVMRALITRDALKRSDDDDDGLLNL